VQSVKRKTFLRVCQRHQFIIYQAASKTEKIFEKIRLNFKKVQILKTNFKKDHTIFKLNWLKSTKVFFELRNTSLAPPPSSELLKTLSNVTFIIIKVFCDESSGVRSLKT